MLIFNLFCPIFHLEKVENMKELEYNIKDAKLWQRELDFLKAVVAEREFLAQRTERLCELWHKDLETKKERIKQLEQLLQGVIHGSNIEQQHCTTTLF